MATLALSAAGAALGSALFPSGISVLGTTLTGAALGTQVGSLAGAVIDQALLAGSGRAQTYEGPRLEELRVTASTEGVAIPRVYGAARLGGQIIWAMDFEEEVTTERVGGGKGGGSRGTRQTTFSYYASFAVGVCAGPISGIGRVWADGQELNTSDLVMRVYAGDEVQQPDSLIAAHEISGEAPAYRGLAYVVFERLGISDFGNRIPQLSFEVFRNVDSLYDHVKGVVMIPGSGEFVYATEAVVRRDPAGDTIADNVNTSAASTDFLVSLDQLTTSLPQAKTVSLVVSWFGTDLRAGQCEIKPGVDRAEKLTKPFQWSVNGVTRGAAHEISITDGRANYGGTPSDRSVIQAVQEMKARGIAITLTPFILMDIPPGNTLSDPYTGEIGQAAFPWRGRITLDPAPGRSGSPDQTSAAEAQIASFVGQAAVSDFSISNGEVHYHGPNEWSLRRQVLHCAHLAVAAGGVDAILLGSELRALTQSRSGPGTFPFVATLVQLAADVKQVVGPGTQVSYAADWSEYFGYQPMDGSGDVFFHLDPLWASPGIDAVGIDVYWPLADWRDGAGHTDAGVAGGIYDLDYLRANLNGGEGYDWFYASDADRDAQTRTPITDGAGKPWVFRTKDVAAWWSNAHFDRPGGVESAVATAWQPMSKPIWFTEVGCPAIDKGANQPNVFVDPKSSESAAPYYSSGGSDELMQRRYIEALVGAFDPAHPAFDPDLNSLSPVYGGRMVPSERIYLYAWDARPYPAFPNDREVWSDGANWRYGHWLNGRTAAQGLAAVLGAMADDFQFCELDATDAEGLVSGLVVDRVMSFREAVQPLELAYFFDFVESAGKVTARRRRNRASVADLTLDNLAERGRDRPLLQTVRRQETELPQAAKLTYVSRDGRYASEVADAQRRKGHTNRISEARLGLMMDAGDATGVAHRWLFETWAGREQSSFALPPSRLAIEPGDRVAIQHGDRTRVLRVNSVVDANARDCEAQSVDDHVYSAPQTTERPAAVAPAPVVGPATAAFLDLPLLTGAESETSGYVALAQAPWPGPLGIYRSPTGVGFTRAGTALAPAIVGELVTSLDAGPLWVFDRANAFEVQLISGTLESVGEGAVFDGANLCAVETNDGAWELLQFRNADLIGDRRYRLSNLLRGQLGSDALMPAAHNPGAHFVMLDARLNRLDLTSADMNRAFTWRFGPDGRAFGGPSFDEQPHAYRGVGRRPYAPVHVRGQRTDDGVLISWTRRSRIDADNWEQPEVPLGEVSEAYQVDVFDGASVVRTLVTGQSQTLYATADIDADFATTPDTISVAVHQMSGVFGHGLPARGNV